MRPIAILSVVTIVVFPMSRLLASMLPISPSIATIGVLDGTVRLISAEHSSEDRMHPSKIPSAHSDLSRCDISAVERTSVMSQSSFCAA